MKLLNQKILSLNLFQLIAGLILFCPTVFATVSVENDISINIGSSRNNVVSNNKEVKIKEGISKAITQIQTTVNGKTVEDLKIQSFKEPKKVTKTFKDKDISAKTSVLIKRDNLTIKKIDISKSATKGNTFLNWLLNIFQMKNLSR